MQLFDIDLVLKAQFYLNQLDISQTVTSLMLTRAYRQTHEEE